MATAHSSSGTPQKNLGLASSAQTAGYLCECFREVRALHIGRWTGRSNKQQRSAKLIIPTLLYGHPRTRKIQFVAEQSGGERRCVDRGCLCTEAAAPSSQRGTVSKLPLRERSCSDAELREDFVTSPCSGVEVLSPTLLRIQATQQ